MLMKNVVPENVQDVRDFRVRHIVGDNVRYITTPRGVVTEDGIVFSTLKPHELSHCYTDAIAFALANIDGYADLGQMAYETVKYGDDAGIPAEQFIKELARLYEHTIIPD